MKQKKIKAIDFGKPFPLLPLRDIVVFPGMVTPLFVGRPKSVKALDQAFGGARVIMLATQKSARVNEPSAKEICRIGCLAEILQILRLPDGTVKALVEGISRATITQYVTGGESYNVMIDPLTTSGKTGASVTAMARTAQRLFDRFLKINPDISKEAAHSVMGIEHIDTFVDAAAARLVSRTKEKQKILETLDLKKRLRIIIDKTRKEIEILQLEKQLRGRVRKQIEKSQRDYYLTEQMKAIQKELGRTEGDKTEFDEFRDRIMTVGMPGEVKDKALKELGRLEQMPPMSAEGTVIRNYLDWLLDVPWKQKTRDKLDIKQAGKTLDEDHYGLEKVKERILEYLAVRKLVKKMKGPILCFVGPPGVGKTSLGRSIARAMGRKFVRFSLGGVRDEAEIRGHRRTYIGAMPGRIIQGMKRAGARNPVIMLDEIDKVSSDFRGDPSSALLEALDPEQNFSFNDHYLEVDYDLSEVMFITTANTLHNIPRPLRDRMEVISISGYNDVEKAEIARRFLVPKQIKEHGLDDKTLSISAKSLQDVIRGYTREAGVRELERCIARICRKTARKVAEKTGGKARKTIVREDNIARFLGEIKYLDDAREKKSGAGVATGLAWTEVGGVLLKVETMILEGKGKLILTGKLGDVMKESAHAALSYIRARAKDFGLAKGFYNKIDIHVHIPEGAIPKDGPSAGITLASSIVSALLNIPTRPEVAMTGEITLRGHVLAIGGLKEKLLAAQRAGMATVIIPAQNRRDMKEIPANVTKGLSITAVEHMDETLELVLTRPPWKKAAVRKSARRMEALN